MDALAFSMYYQGQCSMEELAEHLMRQGQKPTWSGRLPIEEDTPVYGFIKHFMSTNPS